MMPTAQRRLTQIPTPRFAKKNVSGIEIRRTRTSTVAIEPSAIAIEALRHRGRHVDAHLAQHDEQDRGEPEEEHDLPDRPGVPADDRDGRALALARVPAGQRRDGEEEAEEEGQPSAEPGRRARPRRTRIAGASGVPRDPSGEEYGVRPGWRLDRVGDCLQSARGQGRAHDCAARRRRRRRSIPEAVERAYRHAPRAPRRPASAGSGRSGGRASASGSCSCSCSRPRCSWRRGRSARSSASSACRASLASPSPGDRTTRERPPRARSRSSSARGSARSRPRSRPRGCSRRTSARRRSCGRT